MPFTLAGIALVAIWAIVTVTTQAPGWIHLLLTVGVSLWVYGVAKPKAAGTK